VSQPSAAAPIRVVDRPCSGCGCPRSTELYRGREHEYQGTTDELFPVVRCDGCGLVRLNPRPDASELSRIYPPDYYAYHRAAEPAHRLPITERVKRGVFQKRLAALVDGVGESGRPIRLLDVGCADGRMLDWARAAPIGDRVETHGIEMDAAAAAAATQRGHRVVVGRFEEDRELEPGFFDVILASHVIEHVENPEAFARRGAELLALGGRFVVSTPNVASADARRFGAHWGGNHFPRHWTLYDAPSVHALAGRAGLAVERIDYEPNPIFWNWTMHSWLRGRFRGARWPDRLFPPVRVFESSPYNFVLLSGFTVVDSVLRRATGQTGSMAVVLRKPA
jgi:2-polyprenyl-3-methyl-5-hydroxy-6-metoxy-1,4-benzoquinol methylase